MIIADIRRLGDLRLGFTLGCELLNSSVGQARDELLSLGAPANTANLVLQRIDGPLLQVGHEQIPITGDDRAQLRLLSRGVRK